MWPFGRLTGRFLAPIAQNNPFWAKNAVFGPKPILFGYILQIVCNTMTVQGFLAVQNSSIGDLVTDSLTHSLTFTFDIFRKIFRFLEDFQIFERISDFWKIFRYLEDF